MSSAGRSLLRSFPQRRAEESGVGEGRIVYCVPAAGTGARGFLAPFARAANRDRIRVVQLPGREDRMDEPWMDDIVEMGVVVADAITAEGVEDYALFGHSFGAFVMLQVAREIERLHATIPAVLAVAACAPPDVPLFENLADKDRAGIGKALQELGGLDFSGPGGEALAEFVLPTLEADVRACTRYLAVAGHEVIASPIVSMSGAEDPVATTEKMSAWGRYTASAFVQRTYPGGHFFPLESETPLEEVVAWSGKD